MIDLIEIFQNQDKLKEDLTYLKKAKSIDPRIKRIRNFFDDISSKQATKKLHFSDHNKMILENLEKAFEENKDKISEERYQTFYHEFGHIYTALASGFDFSAIIINDKKKKILHVFFLENELSTKVLYYRYNIKSNRISSNGLAIFYYKDYLRDNDIHEKVSLIGISGFIAQQIYLKKSLTNRCSWLRSRIIRCSLFSSFGITPIRTIRCDSDACQISKNVYLAEKNEAPTKIDFINDLNDIHEILYNNTGTKVVFNKYPINDISREIQNTMTSTSKIKF